MNDAFTRAPTVYPPPIGWLHSGVILPEYAGVNERASERDTSVIDKELRDRVVGSVDDEPARLDVTLLGEIRTHDSPENFSCRLSVVCCR